MHESQDAPILEKQRELLRRYKAHEISPPSFAPFSKPFFSTGSLEDIDRGRLLLQQGKVGCLLIAGGQASRLNVSSPKGMFPVSIIEHKSLFQLFSEKVAAASELAGCDLPMAIMTSSENHAEIVDFFEKHHFFSLKPEQVRFFCQEDLPLLDDEGSLILQTPSKIARGPDGNGGALHYFVQSGIWQEWMDKGVSIVHFGQIDNPLADPFDAELLGFHERMGNEITIKSTTRKDLDEKVGLLVEKAGKIVVLEYTEFPLEEWSALLPENRQAWKHAYANLSLYSLNMDFIGNWTHTHPLKELPLHLAYKAVPSLKAQMAWKFERFIFDLLPFAQKTSVLVYPRHLCYAPLKNSTGEYSIESVRSALQALDYQIFYRISGKVPPTRPFELGQGFHYPTKSLLQKWKGRDLPTNLSYIEG